MEFTNHRRLQLVVGLAVCLVSVALLASRLHYGFLPEDDAAFANLAERTLGGELPNVDFYDDYTGGSTYLNALALRLFGMDMVSPRIMLLIFFVPFVLTIWWLATRITSTLNAALITLASVVWSVPVYPCPFGSWYNLYFAAFGTACLVRYLETRRQRWIFFAGICGGLSFLAKICALYFISAAGLFLIFDEQERHAQTTEAPALGSRWYSVLLSTILVLFALALVQLVRSTGTVRHYYYFVLPGTTLALFLIGREWKLPRQAGAVRLRAMATCGGPFLLGIVVPVAIFLIPYIERHAVAKWTASLLGSSARLYSWTLPPMPAILAIVSVPSIVTLGLNADYKTRRSRRAIVIALWIIAVIVLLFATGKDRPSELIWLSLMAGLPLFVVAGALLLWKKEKTRAAMSPRLMLLLSVAGMCSVIQFPYAATVYFCFAAPFVFLVLGALFETTLPGRNLPSMLAPLCALYLAFGWSAVLPSTLYLGHFVHLPEKTSAFSRGSGFIGPAAILEPYERAVPEVMKHAGTAPIYAGPDASEFCFLTGRKNATPIFLEFLAGEDGRPSRILLEIDHAGVLAVVINHGGEHNPSGPPTAELLAGLRARFPESKVIDRFEIRWKPAPVISNKIIPTAGGR